MRFDEQVFQMIGGYRESRAASTPEARVFKIDSNGILICKPSEEFGNESQNMELSLKNQKIASIPFELPFP